MSMCRLKTSDISKFLPLILIERRTCRIPTPIDDGRVEPYKFRYDIGSTVKYICNDKYRLSRDLRLTCRKGGKWSSERLPRCVRSN